MMTKTVIRIRLMMMNKMMGITTRKMKITSIVLTMYPLMLTINVIGKMILVIIKVLIKVPAKVYMKQ